jgi:hypothetical protein
MKSIFLLVLLSLSAKVAWAAGSGRPASDFAGTFQRVEGGSLVDQNKTVWDCPEAFEAKLFENKNSKGKVIGRTLRFIDGENNVLPSISGINLGKSWVGANFEEAFTTQKSLIFQQGFELYDPGRPGRPPYDPGIPPKRATFINYTYTLSFQKDASLMISTSKRGSDSCVYLKR